MPNGTTRFGYKAQPSFHYVGCVKTTGLGAVANTAKTMLFENVQ